MRSPNYFIGLEDAIEDPCKLLMTSCCHHLTPIGWLTICVTHLGLAKIEFGQSRREFGQSRFIEQTKSELNEYFSGARSQFSVPFHLEGTDFQRKVWAAMQLIPLGAIPSYSDIADDIGRPKAARAVGMAANRNPVPILIPCHRVIGHDGGLVGYVGGLAIKRLLLDFELRHQKGKGFGLTLDQQAPLSGYQIPSAAQIESDHLNLPFYLASSIQ